LQGKKKKKKLTEGKKIKLLDDATAALEKYRFLRPDDIEAQDLLRSIRPRALTPSGRASTPSKEEEQEEEEEEEESPLSRPLNILKAEFQLKKLLLEEVGVFDLHQWPDEKLRWTELLRCLLYAAFPGKEKSIPAIIYKLTVLNLLDTKKLAKSKIASAGSYGEADTYAIQILEILSDYGFTSDEAQKALLILQEAARNTQSNYGGKIQRYLREYGNMMLAELSDNFEIPSMDKDAVRVGFSIWLQNTLEMPVNSKIDEVERFLTAFGISEDELIQLADKLDINLALVDDLILRWNEYQKESKGRKSG